MCIPSRNAGPLRVCFLVTISVVMCWLNSGLAVSSGVKNVKVEDRAFVLAVSLSAVIQMVHYCLFLVKY